MGDAEHGTDAARRRVVSDVDRMCRGDVAPPVAELSDRAALLVALGLTTPAVRDVVLRRLHHGLPMPTIGGFHQLRVIEEQRHAARRVLEHTPGSMLRLAVRTRLAELDRRHLTLRAGFVRAPGVFATRGRDIRTDRRNGVHLDTTERAQLFDALASTPTLQPVPLVPRTVIELGAVAAARGQREMGRVPLPQRVQTVVETLPPMPAIRAERTELPEMYTAMIMEAAGLYDRLQLAYRRGEGVVDEIRLQFDAESELVDIAHDLCRLREAATEAGRLPDTARFSGKTGLGPAIDGVWTEIVERTVALRELVESVEARVREHLGRLEAMERTARQFGVHPDPARHVPGPVDRAAEHLVHGAGNRELSIETMRRLRGQVDRGA